MIVSTHTRAAFVVTERPWRVGAFLGVMALAFAVGGVQSLWVGDWALAGVALICLTIVAGLAAWVVEWSSVRLDRDTGTLTLVRRTLRGREVRTWPLSEIVDIDLESDPDDSRALRLRVVTAAPEETGPVLPLYYRGGAAVREAQRAARAWLADSGQAG